MIMVTLEDLHGPTRYIHDAIPKAFQEICGSDPGLKMSERRDESLKKPIAGGKRYSFFEILEISSNKVIAEISTQNTFFCNKSSFKPTVDKILQRAVELGKVKYEEEGSKDFPDMDDLITRSGLSTEKRL